VHPSYSSYCRISNKIGRRKSCQNWGPVGARAPLLTLLWRWDWKWRWESSLDPMACFVERWQQGRDLVEGTRS
jgi:hypothetical protein